MNGNGEGKMIGETYGGEGKGNGNVEEQEKKQKKRLSREQVAKVWESMKGKPLPVDFDEWETPLRADIVEALHKILKEQDGSNEG